MCCRGRKMYFMLICLFLITYRFGIRNYPMYPDLHAFGWVSGSKSVNITCSKYILYRKTGWKPDSMIKF